MGFVVEPLNEDETRQKAERLVESLNSRGVDATLYYDRGPWCARVPLTEEHGDEYAPAFYVYVESTDYDRGPWCPMWRWHGAIGGMDEYTAHCSVEWSFEFIERTWLGDTEAVIASYVQQLVDLLVLGVAEKMETGK